MTTVLIADASKPSVVMTSEIFKDKLQGALVFTASSGAETLERMKELKPDICVVDFDLPDVDGPTLIQMMRRTYEGPILMTAFSDDIVYEAVAKELFAYNDASSWIPKPVNFKILSEKIDLFLIDGHRLDKRFDYSFPTKLVARASGRGKRAPKALGTTINISLNGVCVELSEVMKIKKNQELLLTISANNKDADSKMQVPNQNQGDEDLLMTETKIKAKVAWHTSKDRVGLRFCNLSNSQKNCIVSLLRSATPLNQSKKIQKP